MRLLGLEFGFGQIASMNHPPITMIWITNGFEDASIPLFVLGILAFVVAIGTKVILYGV